MAPDERDRIFDKALARHLRAAGSSQDPANSSSRESARVGECPGPETLGAYHERSLLPEEMNSWKEHIVGCANCQTILSHLEATDEIPLHAAVEDKVLAQQESAHHVAASVPREPIPRDEVRSYDPGRARHDVIRQHTLPQRSWSLGIGKRLVARPGDGATGIVAVGQ